MAPTHKNISDQLHHGTLNYEKAFLGCQRSSRERVWAQDEEQCQSPAGSWGRTGSLKRETVLLSLTAWMKLR